MLQCVAVCCGVLSLVALMNCSGSSSVLQCVAVCCSVLQCVAASLVALMNCL